MEKAILLSSKHKDYLGIQWVLKAIDKKNNLHNLNFLNIAEGLAVGTDGKRLHEYTLSLPDEFEPALYRFFIVNSKTILIQNQQVTTYPEWKNLFLNTAESNKKIELSATSRGDYLNVTYAKFIKWLSEEEGIDLHYLKDVLSFGGEYKVFYYEPFKQIVFINGNHRAMVMPIRL